MPDVGLGLHATMLCCVPLCCPHSCSDCMQVRVELVAGFQRESVYNMYDGDAKATQGGRYSLVIDVQLIVS